MTERDSGRYDAFTDSWIDQNVKVDFVWGNVPLQPNDDREGDTLDPELDNHITATSGYEGFPAFIQGGIYDDLIPNSVVPNLIGMNLIAVGNALEIADLVGNQSLSTVGATSENNGLVKSQAIPAGTPVNAGTTLNYVSYNYVAANPIAGLSTTNLPAGWTLEPGQIVMYLIGRTVKPVQGGDPIKIVGNTNNSLNQGYNVTLVANDDHYNTGGTAVKLTAFEKAFDTPNTNSGGTWQDYFA